MSQIAAGSQAAGPIAWARVRLAARQEQISERAHLAGDQQALAQGWTVTYASSRLGFGGRTYRDPRFDRRKING